MSYRYDLLIAYSDQLSKSALVQIANWADKAIKAIDASKADDPSPLSPEELVIYDRFVDLFLACKKMVEILK